MKKQTPAWGRGCETRAQKYSSECSITRIGVSQSLRPGILEYRRQRTPGDICAAIMSALDREVRLARATGVNTPPDVLDDISAWIARGCLPS